MSEVERLTGGLKEIQSKLNDRLKKLEKVKKIFLDLKPKAKANPDDHPLQVKVHNARDIMEELNDQISDLAMQVKNVNRAIGKAAAQEQKAAKDRKA